MRRLFEGGVYSARRTSTVSSHAPSARECPRPLALSPARAMADIEFALAQFSFSSVIRGHHVYLATHLRSCIKCGYCSGAAGHYLRRLFEGGVSGCGVYSRKYGNRKRSSSLYPYPRPADYAWSKICIIIITVDPLSLPNLRRETRLVQYERQGLSYSSFSISD